MRVLILEDDPIQLDMARNWLQSHGHNVTGVQKGNAAVKALERETFDLAILDWMVPDYSGQEVLCWARKRAMRLPIMFATSCDEEMEIAAILNLGADDYVVKPLRRMEFVARVEALGRRVGAMGPDAERPRDVGPFHVDPGRRFIALHGTAVRMTPRMTDVALVLFRKVDELVSRAQLYEEAWGRQEMVDTRTVDTHVSRLRQALELDGRHGLRLSAIYQHGYRLERTAQPAG